MGRIAEAAPGVARLDEIGAFLDAGTGGATSVGASPEAMQAGVAQLFGSLGDVPFDEWEARPRELLTLPEAVPTRRG